MTQYLSILVSFYFAGLLLSAIFTLRKNCDQALRIFVAANILGTLAGVIYFLQDFGQTVVLANLDDFFHFAPQLNLLSAIFFTVISGASALVGIYSMRYLELYKETYDRNSVEMLMAFFVLGMQGVLLASNPFGFLFFWEVMSVSSFFLVMADKSTQAIKAAFLYFIMTHLGASAILGGFLILGQGNLFFDFSSLASAAQSLSPAMLAFAFWLFLFGFGSKAGLVPFHVWLPEAHPQAPSNISAMMSGLMLKVAVYGFIMVAFKFTNVPAWLVLLVIALGIISAFLGVLNAVLEKDIKRAFAYSSIENMGIIFTMLGLALWVTNFGGQNLTLVGMAILAYAIFHAISHAFFKTGLFLSSGVVMNRFHTKNMNVMGGLVKIMPIFSFAFLLAILSSLPIAPFGTFYGEWGLVQNILTVLRSQAFEIPVMLMFIFVLAVMGIVGGLAVFAMVKIFAISMLGLDRSKHVEKRAEKTDYLLTLPIFVLAMSVLGLGLFAQKILGALMSKDANILNIQVSNKSMFLSSPLVFVVLFGFLLLVIAAKKLVIKKTSERIYHTWDCGQPINETMEYTATAFSAPIRFFFLNFIHRVNKLNSEAVVETNPWIRKFTFDLVLESFMQDKIYAPVANFFVAGAEKLKKIQSGRIQYYLLFLLFTLIVTLMIVL